MNPSATYCPRDASEPEYLAHCRLALAAGHSFIPPSNAEQLDVIVEHYPYLIHKYLPAPESLELMGLPRWYGKPVRPINEQMKERCVETLVTDQRFAKAVAQALKGAT